MHLRTPLEALCISYFLNRNSGITLHANTLSACRGCKKDTIQRPFSEYMGNIILRQKKDLGLDAPGQTQTERVMNDTLPHKVETLWNRISA